MKEVCRVCFLLEGNKTKKSGKFCETCEAFICNECENNWLRRGLAALKDKFENK